MISFKNYLPRITFLIPIGTVNYESPKGVSSFERFRLLKNDKKTLINIRKIQFDLLAAMVKLVFVCFSY